jgi:hypothetical protein
MLSTAGADADTTRGNTRRSYIAQTQTDRSGAGSSDPAPNIPAAVDLLERQACNCDICKTGPCLRCELLTLLGAPPVKIDEPPQKEALF